MNPLKWILVGAGALVGVPVALIVGVAVLGAVGVIDMPDPEKTSAKTPGRGGARVTRVIDGDTVQMERLGRVRLIGVDTPEQGRCYENEATRFTKARLEGQVVQYEVGAEPKDRYERTLAYLSRNGEMHNLALLAEGYAKVLTSPPNDKYAERFRRAQRGARAEDEGLWDACDRNSIRAQRAADRRERDRLERSRAAASARRTARREAAREQRRARAARTRAAAFEAARARAARGEPRRARERARSAPTGGGPSSPSGGGSGGNGGSCKPQTACPGRRDGDGDGCYCE